MPAPQRSVWEINEGRFSRRTLEVDGCLVWTGSVQKKGGRSYPIMPYMDPGTREEKTVYARRYAWEQEFGPIPKKSDDTWQMMVVNVCGNDHCVKPQMDHNQLITSREKFEDVRTSGNKGNRKAPRNEEEFLG